MSEPEPILPPQLRATLPPLYATEDVPDPVVHAKLFTPWAGWTWYVTEFDGCDTLFGLVSGHEVELGYFSLREIEELRGPGGLRVERDLHFSPKPLNRVQQDLDQVREQPDDAHETAPSYRAPNDPLKRPAIRLVETRLSGAWEQACSPAIKTPADAAAIVHRLISSADREQFVALYLNSRHQLTHAHIVSTGTVSSALVHPREVFKAAVLANATAVIVGHNHPSGDVSPSEEDRSILERLKQAGKVLGIEILDALIVSPGTHFYCENTGAKAPLRNSGSPLSSRGLDTSAAHACRNLLVDIGEVLERVGEQWWDETVTAGRRHRQDAEKLSGQVPYASPPHAEPS